MNTFCRLCGETKSSEKHIHLDLDHEKLQEISRKVKLLNVVCNLTNHETCSNTVCIVCYHSLNTACEFIDRVTKAQTVVSKYLSNNLDQDVHVSVDDLEDNKPVDYNVEDNLKQESEEGGSTWLSYKWKCSHCSEVCNSCSALRQHSIKQHGTCCAFGCNECPEIFDSFDWFIIHVRNHRNHLRNYCKYCDIFEYDEKKITDHEKWHDTFDVCTLCGEIFTDHESLLIHKKLTAEGKKDKQNTMKLEARHESDDSLCSLSLEDDLLKHKKLTAAGKKNKQNTMKLEARRESDDSLSSLSLEDDLAIGHDIPPSGIQINKWSDYPWICRTCKVAFYTIDTLRSHMKMKHEKCAALQCLDCDAWFGEKIFLTFLQHIGSHRPSISKTCFYCLQEESSKEELRRHVQRHHIRGCYYCKKCGQLFSNEQEQQEHFQYFKAAKEETQSRANKVDDKTCHICNKVLSEPYALKTHIENVHMRKKNFTCDQCGASYYFKEEFIHHQSAAHGDQIFKCKLCDKTFKRKMILRRHIAWHSSEKPFSCDVCGLAFKLKSLLKNHRTIHADVKPFSCQHCSKSFRLKSFLQRHEIIHTGLKPYSCKICNVAYADRQNCYNHMKKKHNIQRSTATIEVKSDEEAESWKKSVLKRVKPGKKPKKVNLDDN